MKNPDQGSGLLLLLPFILKKKRKKRKKARLNSPCSPAESGTGNVGIRFEETVSQFVIPAKTRAVEFEPESQKL